jgi:hypothetical protein
MASQNAKIDDNFKKSLLGVDEASGELKRVKVDANGRLEVVGDLSVGNLNDIGDVDVGVPGVGDDGKHLQWDNGAAVFNLIAPPAGGGDVTAAAVMTDNTLIKGDGGAKGVQDSGVTLSDADALAGVASIDLNAGGALTIATANIISDVAGTATLSNIDALDATTEATIEAAIDTLANLTTTGALDAGSITSNFGAIDNGASNITTTGTGSFGPLGFAASSTLSSGAVPILSDAAGTMTLSNIDALDATTEATIEAAIDTLANLTSIQSVSVTLADAGADAIFGWDDTAGAYENLTQAEVLAVIGSASLTAQGVVEIATAAETTTGSDATRALSPDGLAGSDYGKRVIAIEVFGPTTDTATGDGAKYFRIPSVLDGYNIVEVAAQVVTAGTTNTLDIQIHNVTDTVDVLSTKLTIDSAEVDSSTAATAAVINGANDAVATADQFRIDIDAVHTTAAKGLIVEITLQLP